MSAICSSKMVRRVEDCGQEAAFTDSWERLVACGFPHRDLLTQVRRFSLYAEQFLDQDDRAAMDEVLEFFGDGFLRPFHLSSYSFREDDPHFGLKLKVRNAIAVLADSFGNRVSGNVWRSLATIWTRENPLEEVSVAEVPDLPADYELVDGIIHGMAIATGFMNHVQSVLYAHTGMIFRHGCGCSHALLPLDSGKICAHLSCKQMDKETADVFTHMVTQAFVLKTTGLPFALGLYGG